MMPCTTLSPDYRIAGRFEKRSRANAATQQTRIAALHIDIHDFKQLNDTLGNSAGDYILRYVARVLSNTASGKDFIVRIGSDEFVVLTPFNGDTTLLETKAVQLMEALAGTVDYRGEICIPLRVTTSPCPSPTRHSPLPSHVMSYGERKKRSPKPLSALLSQQSD